MRIPWYLMAKAKGGGGYKTASGPIVSVSDAQAAPLRSLVANIEPVQEGTGDPSPDNVRPISGWSAVNVWLEPTYDPTENPTATIQLGDTYYGGTLDVTNGVLTVDRAMVDLGTLTWVYKDEQYNTKPFVAHLDNALIPSSSSIIIPALCSNYLQVAPNQMNIVGKNNIYAICLYFSGNHELQILDNRYTDAVTFKTAMSGVQLVYELATPITIPLTATQISTLQGENNLWADSGNVTVEYLASGGINADLMKLAVAFMGKE